jgi:hypothetical protein
VRSSSARQVRPGPAIVACDKQCEDRQLTLLAAEAQPEAVGKQIAQHLVELRTSRGHRGHGFEVPPIGTDPVGAALVLVF